MSVKQSPILLSVLKPLEKYFKIDGVNEIMISKEFHIEVLAKGKLSTYEDKELKKSLLNSFLKQLANDREQEFDKHNVELATSIPNTRYRVYALHSSILIEQDFQINIRIPNDTIYPLDDFEFDNDINNPKLIRKKIVNDYNLKEGIKFSKSQIISLVESHQNILICGGTNSGKTALMNCLLSYVEIKERIVTIEDSAELSLKNESTTRILVQKGENAKYTYKNGVDSANRLNPDRIIVGELDTNNTLAFLRLSNTGKKGMIASLHTNEAVNEDIIDTLSAIRLNVLMQENIEEKTIDTLFSTAIDYIIYISPMSNKQKKIITNVINLKEYFKRNNI